MDPRLVEAREELYIKRRGRCEYCGVQMSREEATLDHWMPRAMGGTNKKNNLLLACKPCNNKKASMTPWEWMTREKTAQEGGLK